MAHPAVALTAPSGEMVEIDEEMADLIKALWERGIATTDCCQGDVQDDWNSAYVSIEAYDFPRFLDLVGDLLEVPSEAAKRHLNIHLGCRAEFLSYWANNMREEFSGIVYHKDDSWHVAMTLRIPAAFVPELTAAVEAA